MGSFTYIPPQPRTFSRAAQLQAPEIVEDLLRQLGFSVLEHPVFTAYYEGGDSSDPVCYRLIVARCSQPALPLPESLQEIDRTACVDRKRLLFVARQTPMRGNLTTLWTQDLEAIQKSTQALVDALKKQVAEDKVEARYLPLPKITADLARQEAPKCDVLVLMPHPDDESIYAGGTIAALTEAGQSVRLVIATDGVAGRGGNAGQLAAQRADELRRAAESLGIEQVEHLGLPDFGKYRDRTRTQPVTAADTLSKWGLDQTLRLMVSKIRSARPRILLTLHPEVDPNYSLHGHHLGLGVAALVAFHLAADPGFIVPDAPGLSAWAVEAHHAMIPPQDSGQGRPQDNGQDSGQTVRRIEINRDRKLQAVQAYQTQHYSTQRLITALQSDSPAVNFETLQVLQARCHRAQLTAVAVSAHHHVSAHPPNISVHQRDWQASYHRLRQRTYPREALTRLLQQQANGWGISQNILANLQKLRDPKTVAVVTGQQVGLFGGPAYTLYKALGAVRLAQQLDTQGIPAVPIFWMASYDHDLDEVQQVRLFSGRTRPDLFSLDLPIARRPVGSTQLGFNIYSLLNEVEGAFKALPYRQDVMAALRAAYQPEATFAQAFARWLNHLTREQGLIILDPAQREFAELVRPMLARELLKVDNSRAALTQTRQALATEGRAEVIPTDRDVLQLFFVDADGTRQRLRRTAGGFEMQSTQAYLSQAAAQQSLDQQPERFTPSALLRPICQDSVLPTIAYVAGPTEQRYFAQLSEVYAWASVPMPEIVARPSFTLMTNNTATRLEQAGGAVALLGRDDTGYQIGRAGLPTAVRLVVDQLRALHSQCLKLREHVKANEPVGNAANLLQQDLELCLATATLTLDTWGAERPLKGLAHLASELPSLVANVWSDLRRAGSRGNPPSTRNITALIQKIERLERTIIRAGRQQNPDGVAAFTKISFNGAPQERHLSVAEVIATHGTSVISQLLPMALPDFGQTRVVTAHRETLPQSESPV